MILSHFEKRKVQTGIYLPLFSVIIIIIIIKMSVFQVFDNLVNNSQYDL